MNVKKLWHWMVGGVEGTDGRVDGWLSRFKDAYNNQKQY